MMLAVSAWGQSELPGCPSGLRVIAGTSVLIDCPLQTGLHTYRWTSKDPSTLSYLSDATAGAPIFAAPAERETPYDIAYRRLVFDEEGALVGQEDVSVTIYRPGASEVPREVRDTWPTGAASAQAVSGGGPGPAQVEPPFLRCVPRITVHSGQLAQIPCTAFRSSGGLLAYRVELDWPPYSEATVLGAGAFEYSVRAPVIEGLASVQRLEIFARVPGADHEVSVSVEVHVINRAPTLSCEDLVVHEAMDTDVPCSLDTDAPVQLQVVSPPALAAPGINEAWPRLTIPAVSRDTSFAVTVRAFARDQVVEERFAVTVRNTAGPADFGIECDPVQREVYEGEPAFDVVCRALDSPTNELAWVWQAEGDTPLDGTLNVSTVAGAETRATFLVPAEVTEDTFYAYAVSATHDDAGTSNRAILSITVLEKPDIAVVCEDAQARTGDPPVRLMCTASNSKGLPLTYQWTWTPGERLSDPAVGTPLFEVPADQQELVEQYVYEVTASADLADPPATPTRVVVTVLKNLGKLSLTCESPIEVYEGSQAVPLNCSVPAPVPPDLVWSWELEGGPEDLLTPGTGEAPPVFQTPASVASTTTWSYLIRADAPPHYDISEPQRVEIIVLTRPVLSLDCPQQVEVTVGQAPQPIECSVTNDRDLDLAYQWRWTPPTRLSDAAVASPLFEVPRRQRALSVTYPYAVTVRAELADPVEASVDVTVLNPAALSAEVIEVTTAGLDLGVVGPRGRVVLDPATEQVSGHLYEGARNAGRLILRTQDSVVVSLEQLPALVLHHAEQARTLTLFPEWAYSESCVQFMASTQASRIVQYSLAPGDCQVMRIGGAVSVEGAVPGTYSGDAAVVLTLNGTEEIYTVPVTLTVGAARQVVVLGPSGARIEQDPVPAYGEEQVHIWPQVGIFGPERRRAAFEVRNPSRYPMEVEVSAAYGYREHGDNGSVLVTDPVTGPGNLATALTVYPGVVVVQPGETRHIQAAITAPVGDRTAAGVFNFTVTPRSYIDQSRAPVPGSMARIRYQVPAIYLPDSEPAALRAQVVSQTDDALTVLFETDTVPFYGQVRVLDHQDRELGRSDLLVVTRSRARIPLADSLQKPFRLNFLSYSPNRAPPADVHISDDL